MWSLAVIAAIYIKISIAIQCSRRDGEVRLVSGTTLQEGRLEVCLNSSWVTVCDENWKHSNVWVVCRQLGYRERAGRAIHGSYFGQGDGPMVLDNVTCAGTETTLLSCSNLHHKLVPANSNCSHNHDISVRCILKEDQRVKNINISVDIIDINAPSTMHTAFISWVLQNTTTDEPTSFDVKCSSEQHSITMSVSGLNVTTQLMGLLPVTSYNCCVSAIYELYQADGICDEIETPELFISATTMNQISSRASDYDSETQCHVIGGVIGFIVVILFTLLIISGVALVYLLVSRRKRNAIPGARLLESVDHGKNRMMDMPICSNLSYVKGHMSNSQAVIVNQLEDGAGPDYSSFGPDYETIDSRSGHGQLQRKNQVPTGRLSEQYEYSEAYLATLNENAPEGLGSANYEVPLKLRQNVGTANEDYSHLKH